MDDAPLQVWQWALLVGVVLLVAVPYALNAALTDRVEERGLERWLHVERELLVDGDYRLLVALNDVVTGWRDGDSTAEVTGRVVVDGDSPFDLRVGREGRWLPAEARASQTPEARAEPLERSVHVSIERCVPHEPCLVEVPVRVRGVESLPDDSRVSFRLQITAAAEGAPGPGEEARVALLDAGGIVAATDADPRWPQPVLLTAAGPQDRRQVVFEIARSDVPDQVVEADGSARLVWAGGAVRATLPTADARGELRIATPAGRTTAELVPVRFHETGDGTTTFEVPFTALCDSRRCTARWDVELELTAGEWLVSSWTNMLDGVTTPDGRTRIRGWTLRDAGSSAAG